jgi:hypothetical protein
VDYKNGDLIDTSQGMLTVQCPISFQPNANPKYDKLGGRTLYWLQDMDNNDIMLWDRELKEILSEEEKMTENINVNEEF